MKMPTFKSLKFFLHFCILQFALQSFISSATKIGMMRNGHKFGVINFDRISGYVLVNATYRTLENVDAISCISECRKNKACHSLNYKKTTTMCELNELDRHAADTELAFQKQPDSDYYEIKSACKGVICHNGARCASNQEKGTAQCRCALDYTGEQCEKYNPYGKQLDKSVGIISNELFRVGGGYNFAAAQAVCNAFDARQPTKPEMERIAVEEKFGICRSGWIEGGKIGYPEYEGNCHQGSTHSGYFSSSCCSDKVTTLKGTWCLKKNIDFCKPGWHGNRHNCFLFRDDDLVTMEEAKEKCSAKNAVIAKIIFNNPSFAYFIKRVCPTCRSMYVGAKKVGDTWRWIPEYYSGDDNTIPSSLWGIGEPRAENDCVEYNAELEVFATLPCNTLRGYICRYQPFAHL